MGWFVERMEIKFRSTHNYTTPDEFLAKWQKNENWINFIRGGSVVLWAGMLIQTVQALVFHRYLFLIPAAVFGVIGAYAWRIPPRFEEIP
jgi:hypothetical protein